MDLRLRENPAHGFIPPKGVEKENNLLAQRLGSREGHPLFQWKHFRQLFRPMTLIDDEGKPILDYYCNCGANIRVHQPGCQFTLPRYRWAYRPLAPHHEGEWLLCIWMPPQCSESDWEGMFKGQVPFPRNGSYVPVDGPDGMVALTSPPERATTEKVIEIIQKERGMTLQDKEALEEKASEALEREKLDKVMGELDPLFSIPGHIPGEKDHVSFGGLEGDRLQ